MTACKKAQSRADIQLIACDHLPCDKNEQFVTRLACDHLVM